MGMMVVQGATLACTFGTAPGSLCATSQMLCLAQDRPAAGIQDMGTGVNIAPFGMCTSLANPQVAAATAGALGVLTPQPCMPVPAGTWLPANPRILIGSVPCLTSDAQLVCANGMGTIRVTAPGQTKVMI